MIYKLNGVVFNINQQQRIGDVNYPHTWFQNAENRAAMGITEEPDIVPTLDEVKTRMLSQIRSTASILINAKYPFWVQINCANGIYPVSLAGQMITDIAAVISASNVAENSVTIATTTAEVNAVKPAWPVI